MGGMKPLPVQIDDAKKRQDTTRLAAHFTKTAQSIMRAGKRTHSRWSQQRSSSSGMTWTPSGPCSWRS
eukprot:4063900-Prymnesium_polylepis.1